jgi:hypothetical protein
MECRNTKIKGITDIEKVLIYKPMLTGVSKLNLDPGDATNANI